MKDKNKNQKGRKSMLCPNCGNGLRAIQYAGVDGSKTLIIPRKYCNKCDKIFKIIIEEE